MKTSYPFMRISQKFNIPYDIILMFANYAKNVINNGETLTIPSIPDDVMADISKATNYFTAAQAGILEDPFEGIEIDLTRTKGKR